MKRVLKILKLDSISILTILLSFYSCERENYRSLFSAAEEGNPRKLMGLMQRNELKGNPGEVRERLFHILVQKYFPSEKNEDLIPELISQGFEIDKEDGQGNTPLFYAVASGNQKICSELIHHGADVNHRNLMGQTPVFRAVSLLSEDPDNPAGLEVLKLFHQAGADIKIVDNEGKNLIHYSRSPEVTRWLIYHGVDFKHRDKHGKTPLDYFSEDIFKVRDELISKGNRKS